MIPAATATAPNDISTLIASDPVSRLASAWRGHIPGRCLGNGKSADRAPRAILAPSFPP